MKQKCDCKCGRDAEFYWRDAVPDDAAWKYWCNECLSLAWRKQLPPAWYTPIKLTDGKPDTFPRGK